jgi:hypothetical protein
MVEVFKTDVNNPDHARLLVDQIHKTFADYKANFDLEDCDNILRIESKSNRVDSLLVIDFLNDFGFYAKVLEDEIPQGGQFSFEKELSNNDINL